MRVLGIVASILYLSGCALDTTPICDFEPGTYELTVAGEAPRTVEFDGTYGPGCRASARSYWAYDVCHYVLYLQCPNSNALYELQRVAVGYWIGTATSGDRMERATLQMK
jgi:hypothetical protein